MLITFHSQEFQSAANYCLESRIVIYVDDVYSRKDINLSLETSLRVHLFQFQSF